MARWRVEVCVCLIAIAVCASAVAARAGTSTRRSHRVTSGDSLWTIARAYRCSVDELRRINRLDGNVIQPGQRLRIPVCKADDEVEQSREARKRRAVAALEAAARETRAREEREREEREADESARDGSASFAGQQASEGAGDGGSFARDSRSVDDIALSEEPIGSIGAAELNARTMDPRFDEPRATEPREDSFAPRGEPFEPREPREPEREAPIEPYEPPRDPPPGDGLVPVAVPIVGQSIGRPQNGYLVSGKRLPTNRKLYHLRRPERAWGTSYTIDQLVHAIRQVRKRYPRVHPLAIGDLSARHGGRISMHGSHQSGRDADLGFYFRKKQPGYPKAFAVAKRDNLDFPATWALISALCKTAADKTGGVERIYMTYRTQAMFYRLARKHGVSRARLDEWFQYPRGRRANHGVIRHEPGHEEHIHVRFKCAANDPECR